MIGWLRNPRYHAHKIGMIGERIAARHVRKQGGRILARNHQTSSGEIDIIAECGGVIHFIEVKTRQSDAFGDPLEAVDDRKKNRIRHIAKAYLSRYSRPPAATSFDIIGVKLKERLRDADVEWQKGLF